MMVVAESKGLLRPVGASDANGRLRESLIFRQLNRDTMSEVVKMKFAQQAAAAQYIPGDTEAKAFEHHWEAAGTQLLKFMSYQQPWVDWDAEIARLEEAERQKDVDFWESQWGSLDDPEVQAETDRLVEWMKSGAPLPGSKPKEDDW